ncbi:MAG: ParB/RepB/Spo0J family partition protein [Candidatus Paceibacterota bacterium]|jgi:ParB/RepB/Spo0J family partition protein
MEEQSVSSSSTLGAAVLVVGARKFVLPPSVRDSQQIIWWDPIERPRDAIPDYIEVVFAKCGLARSIKLKGAASSRGIDFIEFPNEEELLPQLSEALEVGPIHAQETPEQSDSDTVEHPKKNSTTLTLGHDLELLHNDICDVPVARIKQNEGQPRKYFAMSKLLALGRSLLHGQQIPIILVPAVDDPEHDYILYDGERRWRAAHLVHKPTLRAIIAKSLPEAQMFKGSAICNFGREGHQPMEIASALQQIKDEENLSVGQLAVLFSNSESWVVQHLGLLRLTPEVQALMNPELPSGEGITFSVANEVSKLPTAHQMTAVQYIVEHQMNIDEVRHYVRHLTVQVGSSMLCARRKRGPVDDFRILRTFLRKSRASAARLLDLPGGLTLENLFHHRSEDDAERILEEIDGLMASLEQIKAQVAKSQE